MSDIFIKIKLDTDIETLWSAWTEESKITKWFSPHANIEPHVGGAFELFFDPENHDRMSTKGCKIIEIEPPRFLHFQWKGPDQFSNIMNNPPQTSVKLTLEPENSDVLQTIEHTGWKVSENWCQAKVWHIKAWRGVLTDLQEFINQL